MTVLWKGVSTLVENGQHNRIQFNNLGILPNSEMAAPEYQEKHRFHIVETKIINNHGNLSATEEISKVQQLVVGTRTMPTPDWSRVRVFGWMTALLHFDKLLQIPFLILQQVTS